MYDLELEKDKSSPTDLCVLCRSDTGIPKETHIDLRDHYIEGAGQLCKKCGKEI